VGNGQTTEVSVRVGEIALLGRLRIGRHAGHSNAARVDKRLELVDIRAFRLADDLEPVVAGGREALGRSRQVARSEDPLAGRDRATSHSCAAREPRSRSRPLLLGLPACW
jgi:hypothetical protein